MPRLFVLADALHHGSMQAWALGATDTIARPFDAQGILQRIRAAFPDSAGFDATERGKTLNRGVAAAHAVMVEDIREASGRRSPDLRRCGRGGKQDPQGDQALLVAGMADDRRLPSHRQLSPLSLRHRLCGGVRAASWHARGRSAPSDPRGAAARCRQGLHPGCHPGQAGGHSPRRRWRWSASIPRLGYDALAAQGGFPPEMLDVVLHHHEFLDGSGYPDGLRGDQISDIVRLIDHRRYPCGADRAARLPAAVHPRQGVRDHGADGRQARPASAAGLPPGGVRLLLTSVIARSVSDEAIHSSRRVAGMDCFASLAMTVSASGRIALLPSWPDLFRPSHVFLAATPPRCGCPGQPGHDDPPVCCSGRIALIG